MAEIPHIVPLPDVPHYTDEVVFGAMNFPVGFDESRLLVNLRAFDRVRKLGGFGTINIQTKSSRSDDFSVGGRVDSQGTMSIASVGSKERKPLSVGNVTFPSGDYLHGPADVSITIDSKAMDEKAQGAKVPRAAFDPVLKAKLMDSAVRSGLHKGAFTATLGGTKSLFGATGYLFGTCTYGASYIWAGSPPDVAISSGLATSFVMNFLLWPAAVALNAFLDNKNLVEELKASRKSLFFICEPDRYLAAAAIAATHPFIKAQK